MRGKSIFWLLLLIVGDSAWAQNARLPYHLLYSAQKTQMELNRTHTNLVIVLTLQSTSPDVKTSDLAVFIDTKAGKIPVEVGVGGDFAVPLRDDLLSEDPWIITNQRKGTMKLDSRIGVVLGRLTNVVHYTRLMRPVHDSEEVQEQMRRYFPGSPRMAVTGLRLTFLAARTVPIVTIHSRAGVRKLVATQNGDLIIPLSEDLMEEDPEVSLSDSPGAVEIVSHIVN